MNVALTPRALHNTPGAEQAIEKRPAHFERGVVVFDYQLIGFRSRIGQSGVSD
jgi:hypothetical protein